MLPGVVAVLIVLTVLGLRDSPYDRVDPGPALPVGSPAGGSWSVMTVRVRDSTWFQWALAEIRGEHTVRRYGRGTGRDGDDGGNARPVDTTMAGAQTRAVLLAAQLAAGRTPVGAFGLQVTAPTRPADGAEDAPEDGAAEGLRPGDIVLAAGGDDALVPLRAQADLETALAGRTSVRVLVVPRSSDGSWGSATVRTMPASWLAATPMRLAVSAVAYPLGGVEGSSAGLVLALARLDALTPGDLTGGRRIAGTGTIGLNGDVGEVGDVAEKVRAAADARLEVFFVPVWQRREAAAAARGTGVTVVPVRTVPEAVRWLCSTGGRAPIC